MNAQNLKINQDILVRAYATLKFAPGEIKNAINDLAGVQRLSVIVELLKSLTENEIKTIDGLAQKSDEEKKMVMEQIANVHADDEAFKSAARAAAKRVLDNHVAYLKARGDEAQKAEIAKILEAI